MMRDKKPEGGKDREVDVDTLREFRDVMFRHAEKGEIIPIRTVGSGGPVVTGIAKVGGPMDPIIDMARSQAASPPGLVFAPPLILSRNGGAKASDTTGAVALTIDLDKNPESGSNRLIQALGRPTGLVESGGVTADTGEFKLHLHYRLRAVARTKEELRDLRCLRTQAAIYAEGDTSSATYTQPIRWPGSWNTKDPEKYRIARLRELNPEVEIDVPKAIAILEDLGVTAARETEAAPTVSKDALLAPSSLALMGCIAAIPNDDDTDWTRWSLVGMALANASANSEEGRAIFHMWSEKNPLKYNEAGTDERWKHWKTNGADSLGYPNLRSMAFAHGASAALGAVVRNLDLAVEKVDAYKAGLAKELKDKRAAMGW